MEPPLGYFLHNVSETLLAQVLARTHALWSMVARGVLKVGLVVEAAVRKIWAYAPKAPEGAIMQRTQYVCRVVQTSAG